MGVPVVLFALAATAIAACGPFAPGADHCQRLLPGELVITEVFADVKAASGSSGTDTGKEWFEIYNAAARPIELDGLSLTHSRPDGSRSSTHTMTGGAVAPGQYFTLGNAARELPPYIDYGYGADLGELFNSDGGKLVLSCGPSEVDSATYDAVREGHSRQLTSAQPPDYTANDQQASWCSAGDAEFEAGNYGTPGAESDCQPIAAGQCSDGGVLRAAVSPVPGDLVITEVMPSPEVAGDDTGEWFEVRAMHDLDLNGVGLDRAGDGRKPDTITGLECLHVGTGDHVVFARSMAPSANGGIAAAAVFGFSLVAGGPTAPGDVAILTGTTIIDAVRWTRTTTGKALQLDPALVDPLANDSESNFCDATVPYNHPAPPELPDLGTPGAVNLPCALRPPAGMCEDHGAIRAIIPPAPGALVISEILANPANILVMGMPSVDAQREWFEIVNTGATALDLNELAVGRIGAAGAVVQSARCLSVAPGAFAVLARSSEPTLNGMLPAVDATFTFGLVDTGGDIQVARGATVLDQVRWTSVTSGVTRQLDPQHLTTTANDLAASFCAGTTPYGDGSNRGTPGAANTPCP